MDKKINNKYLLVTNRGPDFKTSKTDHEAMGGTKGIYPQIMSVFCDKWLCLMPSGKMAGSLRSEYGKDLEVLSIKDSRYDDYYYKYVSETLYPYLLGYKNEAKKHPRAYRDYVIDMLADKINEDFESKPVIICDYHLYDLPRKIKSDVSKLFFWFVPILTIEHYDDNFKEILRDLNYATEIYFFDDVWANNFINCFNHFLPGEKMKVKVKSLLMGPDEFYAEDDNYSLDDYKNLMKEIFNKNISVGRNILSVSRMDFVKRIPLLIEGFEKYLEIYNDTVSTLTIIAPHHRKESDVYKNENELIVNLVNNSAYKDRIFLSSENLSSNKLKVLYKYAEMFVCPSLYDAMPLTPLEYISANIGTGRTVISNSLGSYRFLSTLTFTFEANDSHSLAYAINEAFVSKYNNIATMKSVVKSSTAQKAIRRLYASKI